VEPVPAADLDLAELRMIEGLPRNMRKTAQRSAAPAQHLEITLGGVLAEPVDEFVIGGAGFAHRRPDLDDPAENAQVLVDPVERAGDDGFRVIAKLVIDGNVRISGEL